VNTSKSIGPVAVAFLVGVAVGALAGTAISFWVSAKNLRESDALLKQARALIQRAEEAARESETAPRNEP
jgi:flagellar basal body-associated protein FliL